MTIEEIKKRLKEIQDEINTRGADMPEDEFTRLQEEAESLLAERNKFNAQQQRTAFLQRIADGDEESTVIKRFGEFKDPEDPYGTAVYRSAWLKKIRSLPMTEAETRAYQNAVGKGAEVIPTQTSNQIISKIKTLVPMLNEMTLLHVKGFVKFVVEGTNNEAAIHTENAAITPAADTLIPVALSGYEIIKLIQISDTVMTMSIDAFEAWIVNMLSESIAAKIENLIFNGTGSSQPKGLEKANTWDTTNSVTVANASSLTAADVQKLISLLKSGYHRNAKFAMSIRTLFTDFMPLEDKSKSSIVTQQGDKYFVYGYPVLLTDYTKEHEAFFGDYKKMCGNLAEEINVKNSYDIDTNSYKYSGISIFDCTPALGEAFTKLIKATA